MDDEKLIKYVRSYEELYNLTHSQYSNANLKDKRWGEIANKVKQPAAACKARWNNIRDNFRKSLRKRITKSGQAAIKFKKYKYEEQLRFLVPFIKERETLNNPASAKRITGDENNISDYDEKDDIAEKDPNQARTITNNTGSSNQDIDDNGTIENVVSASSLQFHNNEKKVVDGTKLKFKTPRTASATFMKNMLERNEKRSQQLVHPVDAFLAGLAPTLKSFNPYHLNIAKTKIFNIVQEIELDEIVQMQDKFGTSPETVLSSPSPCPSPIPHIPSPSFSP